MKPHRFAAVTTATVLALTGVAAAGPAEAAARKPGVVVDYDYHKIKVKPKTFRPYKDVYFSGVRWTKLTKSTGKATAVQHINTCVPDCAAGNYRKARVSLKFNRVRLSDCRKVFTRVKATEVKSRKTRTFRLPVFTKAGC